MCRITLGDFSTVPIISRFRCDNLHHLLHSIYRRCHYPSGGVDAGIALLPRKNTGNEATTALEVDFRLSNPEWFRIFCRTVDYGADQQPSEGLRNCIDRRTCVDCVEVKSL